MTAYAVNIMLYNACLRTGSIEFISGGTAACEALLQVPAMPPPMSTKRLQTSTILVRLLKTLSLSGNLLPITPLPALCSATKVS